MINQASWCDYITFETFLSSKVRAGIHQEDDKVIITYYCANPILAEDVLTVRYHVDAEDNPLVNLDILVEMMQNATSELYQAVSDKEGVVTQPDVRMHYSECYANVPLLEYKLIK